MVLMAAPTSRDAYFEIGLEVLSDLGYGGLKLAEVCRRLGVTSGSFYHYFNNWSAYTEGLVAHWKNARTVRLIELLETESEPRHRLDKIVHIGLNLPHGAEAAIRTWSSIDPSVRSTQVEVDTQRFEAVRESVRPLVGADDTARKFASWAIYVLIGYEQSAMPPDRDAMRWIMGCMLERLDAVADTQLPSETDEVNKIS